jgi:CRISPR-associated protein Cmr2
MNSSIEELVKQIVLAKSRSLLHDPPNKMWVLREHKRVAEKFRHKVVSNVKRTSLGLGPGKEYEEIVKRADVMASTFDRWLINMLYTVEGGKDVVEYTKLHNMFRPGKFFELHAVPEDKALEVAEEIGSILARVDEATSNKSELERIRLLYSLLYFLLEVAWYSRGFHPSLADTRAPTHTVFDHLYATASMVNLSFYDEPRGFIVRVDVPGVQQFISASRKTADFWAGSWILSKLIWGLIEEFVDDYGPDVVLSPTLRLNPYFFNYIVRKLERAGVSGDVIADVCRYYVSVISKLGWEDLVRDRLGVKSSVDACNDDKREKLLEMLTLIPLIPATTYLVLPPLVIPEDQALDARSARDLVRGRVTKAYKRSWQKLLEEAARELGAASERAGSQDDGRNLGLRLLARLLADERVGRVVELPHMGPRVDVLVVSEVYYKLLRCLEGDHGGCSELGIDPGSIARIRGRLESLGARIDPRSLARNLLWHTIMTRAMEMEARQSPIPLPRPFWVLEGEELRPVGDYTILTNVRSKDWKVCSLCGDEPAVVHPPKEWDEGEKREVFKREWLDKVREFLKVQDLGDKELGDAIRRVLRPGEALGPYCLFKRAVGEIYSIKLRDYYHVASTDDVALIALDKALSRDKRIMDGLEARLGDVLGKRGFTGEQINNCISSFKRFILPIAVMSLEGERTYPIIGHDIEEAARSCNLDYESFKTMAFNVLAGVVEDLCLKGREGRGYTRLCVEIVGSMFQGFSNEIEYLGGVTARPRDVVNFAKLRTNYSIVKGDADGIGRTHQGALPPGMALDEYVKVLFEAVSQNLASEERERLWMAYDTARAISGELSRVKEGLIVSPTLTAVISLALQVTALRDVAVVIGSGGFPVYSGGDDVLALLPIERWYTAVGNLRSHFWGDRESLFHIITSNGRDVAVAQALPVGRSFSVRVADIMDVMSSEIQETVGLLEGIAKRMRWRLCDREYEKDTLMVSDSRSRAQTVLPLSTGSTLIAGRVLRTLGSIFIAENTGVLSANIPEDLDRMLSDPITGRRVDLDVNAKLKIIDRVLLRNVSVARRCTNAVDLVLGEILRGIEDHVKLMARNIGDARRIVMEELVEFIRVSRGWL